MLAGDFYNKINDKSIINISKKDIYKKFIDLMASWGRRGPKVWATATAIGILSCQSTRYASCARTAPLLVQLEA
ncbi:hypothetical protein [Hymenobacter nivis]|uniref:Uncharacterized protein n=1 Tax=Hymenobacter nivis TaxID=1850093 RepID=A0A2Z3GFQ2_9BACT|nr:hypothetical protein [Hymenobacter nivis]AWM32569.1 hypothetical protein DDQ68_07070 [Hymenobacter nivis]